MTKVELTEFLETLSPLYPNIKRKDLTQIFETYFLLAEAHTEEELTYIRRSDRLLDRTIFVFPKAKCLYITLKKEDMQFINDHLDIIKRSERLEEIFGIFSSIGFVTQRGRFNTCNPIICVNFGGEPSISLRAKVTRLMCQQNGIDYEQGDTSIVDEEMSYRKQYNDHPCVPRLYHHGYYIGRHGGKDWIKHLEFSELLLRDLLSMLYSEPITFSIMESYSILYQLVHILDVMHDDNIVHGDVKPENIFIGRNEHEEVVAKLGDFGHLSELRNLRTMNGTHNYWSPEQMKYSKTEKSKDQNEIAFASDIWCVGWIIIHLFNLSNPEWYKKQLLYLELYKKRVEGKPNPLLKSTYDSYHAALEKHCSRPCPPKSDFAHYLLWHCWRIDTSKRISAFELKNLLESTFKNLSLPETD
ncbi:MAG: Serine/threonine-protein kinase PknH [Chlamydiae bacterium]|nr:Serine/threonine-protein kinase PknH [Chlamydiota bacterium]